MQLVLWELRRVIIIIPLLIISHYDSDIFLSQSNISKIKQLWLTQKLKGKRQQDNHLNISCIGAKSSINYAETLEEVRDLGTQFSLKTVTALLGVSKNNKEKAKRKKTVRKTKKFIKGRSLHSKKT